jgi:hypothetical protein
MLNKAYYYVVYKQLVEAMEILYDYSFERTPSRATFLERLRCSGTVEVHRSGTGAKGAVRTTLRININLATHSWPRPYLGNFHTRPRHEVKVVVSKWSS